MLTYTKASRTTVKYKPIVIWKIPFVKFHLKFTLKCTGEKFKLLSRLLAGFKLAASSIICTSIAKHGGKNLHVHNARPKT